MHDELKDKLFKLELSWACGQSGGKHQLVPKEYYDKAYQAGVDSKHDDESDNDI